MAVAVAILAAGRGSRFGARRSKVLAPLGGRPLVAHALDTAIGSGLAPVLLVVGRHRRRVARLAPPGVRVVRSRRWRRGIAHSLGAAIGAVTPDPAITALCVGLADQPLVGSAAYRRLAAAHADGAVLAVATYTGARANPVLLDRSLWRAAQALHGDAGARILMRDHPVTEVDCTDTGDPSDVDTLDDLDALTRVDDRLPDRADGGDSEPGEEEREPDADH